MRLWRTSFNSPFKVPSYVTARSATCQLPWLAGSRRFSSVSFTIILLPNCLISCQQGYTPFRKPHLYFSLKSHVSPLHFSRWHCFNIAWQRNPTQPSPHFVKNQQWVWNMATWRTYTANTANTKSWLKAYILNLILGFHVMVNWHQSKQGIRWPVSCDLIADSSLLLI